MKWLQTLIKCLALRDMVLNTVHSRSKLVSLHKLLMMLKQNDVCIQAKIAGHDGHLLLDARQLQFSTCLR